MTWNIMFLLLQYVATVQAEYSVTVLR